MDIRAHAKEHQFDIPSDLNYMSRCYPSVSWEQANNLYAIAVELVLNMFDVEVILDIPFGRGYVMAKRIFKESLDFVEKNNNEGKQNNE